MKRLALKFHNEIERHVHVHIQPLVHLVCVDDSGIERRAVQLTVATKITHLTLCQLQPCQLEPHGCNQGWLELEHPRRKYISFFVVCEIQKKLRVFNSIRQLESRHQTKTHFSNKIQNIKKTNKQKRQTTPNITTNMGIKSKVKKRRKKKGGWQQNINKKHKGSNYYKR